jgi:hypothetical protein
MTLQEKVALVTRPRKRAPLAGGGADGNERLTAATGAVLLLLFVVQIVTILQINKLLTLHFFIGMLLLGPVTLKVVSACYRMVRYYVGAADYRKKGPPATAMRILGPFVLATSLSVLGTGVVLAFTGPRPGLWLTLHKATFVLWAVVMAVHVLVYVRRLPRLIGPDLRVRVMADPGPTRGVLAGRPERWLLLAGSIIVGLAIAVLTVHLAAPWAAWLRLPGPH